MESRDKIIESTMKSYEDEFVKVHGFQMNRQQRRAIQKRIEILVDNELKKER